jgi:hypothetical protein
MVYRLEEKLPVSAEDVVADFIPAAGGSVALGVCAERKTLVPRVDALESRGVAVEVISPSSLLALQHLLTSPPGPPELRDADVLVWQTVEGALELFSLRRGTPASWTLLPGEQQDLLLHLGVARQSAGQPRKVLAIGLREPLRARLSQFPDLQVVTLEHVSMESAAAAMARAVLTDRASAWVNLRRDGLAVRDRLRGVRTPLRFAAAAGILAAVSLCGAMVWRAHRYERLAAAYAAEERAAFGQAFPGQPVPLDVPSRLASEERALRGVSGGDASAPPPDSPALLTLRDLVTSIPAGVRCRVLDLRLESGRFTIEGQALSHGDADSIAAALREGAGFEVEPPRTEQLADAAGAGGTLIPAGTAASAGSAASAVSFTITGSLPPANATPRRAAP